MTLQRVRCYLTNNLDLRDLEELMAKRRLSVVTLRVAHRVRNYLVTDLVSEGCAPFDVNVGRYRVPTKAAR